MKSCAWKTADSRTFLSGCKKFFINEISGSLKEYGIKFCPFCGLMLRVKKN